MRDGRLPLLAVCQPLRQHLQRAGQLQTQTLRLEALPGVKLHRVIQSEAREEVGVIEVGCFSQRDQTVFAELGRWMFVSRDRAHQVVELLDIDP